MTNGAEKPGRQSARGQRAVVLTRLNNGMLRLRTIDGREVTGHAALDLRKALTRLLPGDAVQIELSPFDPTKARILGLARLQEPSQRSQEPSQHPRSTSQPQQRELP